MKTLPHWIAIGVLLSVIAAVGVKIIVLGSTATGKDGRIAVLLDEGERQLVLDEMQLLLAAIQQIVEGLANNDLKQVASAARRMGRQAKDTVDFNLRAKLPLAFKKLGFATHDDFDLIAQMAESGDQPRAIQLQLTQTMNNCITCHASFQIPSLISKGEPS